MRIIHLTFYKCASQWVRDILTDPEISLVTGYPLSIGGIDVAADPCWPAIPESTFAGPIYGASYEDWLANSQEDDRALIILRDPRDLVVSLVFSLGFSHVPSSVTRLLRSPILAASDRDRIRIGIFILTQWADRMRSWGTAEPNGREYIGSYQRLIANPAEEFGAICRFLGWEVDPRLLRRVVDRNSFEKRTDRKPGELNPYSHMRKGQDGDWRNYFDRELGEEFEATFPRLLADLGCEPGTDWFKSLPEHLPQTPSAAPAEQEGRVQELLSRLASFEDKFTELGLWRAAAEDRLESIRELTATIHRLQARISAPNLQTFEHISQINELTSTVRYLERISAERLADNHRLIADIQNLCDRVNEKNVIANERLDQIYELTHQIRDYETTAEERLRDLGRLNEVIEALRTRLEASDKTAAERLAQVHTLTSHIHHLERQAAQPFVVAEERLADIMKLTAHIQSLRAELEEMKKAADDRKKIIDDIRSSASYRFGFLPVSKLGSIFR